MAHTEVTDAVRLQPHPAIRDARLGHGAAGPLRVGRAPAPARLGAALAGALSVTSSPSPEGRSVVCESRWGRLRAEPDGDGDPYYLLQVPDCVTVVARTSEGRILLVRQHRVVTGEQTIELPSGHVDPGETPEQAARRELLEETG